MNNIQLDYNSRNSLINKDPRIELLQFKNEILNEVRESQKLSENKLNQYKEITENKLSKFEIKFNTLFEKLEEKNDNKPMDNIMNDHIKDLLQFQAEAKNNLITINIKLDNLEKDMYNNIFRIDKILTESVIYPGIIGNMCKFKTFHDFMNYLLTQASQNITFKDKTELDLKTFKSKIDKYLKSFSTQLDNLLNEANNFTRKSVEDIELRMKTLLLNIDDKIKNMKINNSKFEKSLDYLKNEINNINEIKEENDKILEEKLSLIQEENNNVMENFSEQKNQLNQMKKKINRLLAIIEENKSGKDKEKIKEVISYRNSPNYNQNLKEIRTSIKHESKIKKYIQGEINADEINAINTAIKNSNKILNKNLNNYNLKEEKKFNINSNSNINDVKENYENNSELYNNNYTETEEDENTHTKTKKSKSNSIKKDLSIKQESYNDITNKKIPKTTKAERSKNSRGEINARNFKNEEITYNNKPKNRNPREINKNLKKKEHKKIIKDKTKEEYESESEENDENYEEKSNEEKDEEISLNNTGNNLSCNDIDEYSDYNEDDYSDNEESEETIINRNKNNRKVKRKISRLALPKIKANKRDSSARISKLKKKSNNNYKSNLKEKENKIKYINSKSRNTNIKNVEIKNDIINKDIFSKKSDIQKNHGNTSDSQKLLKFKKYKNDQSTLTNNINIKQKYTFDYKKIIKEEDIDDKYVDKEKKSNLLNKLSSTNNNEIYSNYISNTKNKNEDLVDIKLNKDSNSYQFSKLNEDNQINNDLNSELDRRQKEIKNLNRNIKNYINSNCKIKESNISSINNFSIPIAILYDKNVKKNEKEMKNSIDFNSLQNHNINENSNIKSRNKIPNKNNNEILNNINNNMNIINNMKNNTYLEMPKMFKDFYLSARSNNQNMTIETSNENYLTSNLNEHLKKYNSTSFRKNELNKNNSATNIYFSDRIKFQSNRISYKNKNYRNNFSKLKPNFSSEIGNNRTNIGFSYSNNSLINSNNNKNFYNESKEKLKNQFDNSNLYYNYEYHKNMQLKNNLDKLDNNVTVNEKVISSPFQAYQTYQKDIKESDFKNNRFMNTNKNSLFQNNNKNNKNSNNNYPINILNDKVKDAQLIQNLISNIQSNIQD